MGQLIIDEIAPDKSGSAGDDDLHGISSEYRLDVFQKGMFRIFFRQDGMLHAPVNADLRIVPADAAVCLGRVVVVRLVQKFHVIGERHEAVAEASGDEELLLIFLGELHGDPLLIRGAVMAEVYRHVEHRAAHTSHELRLRFVAPLEMDAPQRPFHGAHGVIVLHEIIVESRCLHGAPAPALHEEPPMIAEDFRNEDHDAV